ncbi:MAG: extracellular solute-binding protein [Myxococcota bacterium]
MRRRRFLQTAAALTGWACLPPPLRAWAGSETGVSVDALPRLEGKLTLYLGRGEGGLYEDILQAIESRNPSLELAIRRGPTAALANAIVAEARAGVRRADLFWAVDSGAIGLVADQGLAQPLPKELSAQLQPGFQYEHWVPISGRIRTLPYNRDKLTREAVPRSIMALPESGLRIGWAPAYASFQSFVTAMRLLQGDAATAQWLEGMNRVAKRYAGELGVVLGVERGEVDVGLANHYYTLRLRAGKPDARVALAFTENDAGCLVNASGIVALAGSKLAANFIRYLLTVEAQAYLATEAYEIPLILGGTPPAGLPDLTTVRPPKVDLTRLADLRPTLDLMRGVGVL